MFGDDKIQLVNYYELLLVKIRTTVIYTVAKGTSIEGGEENLDGHKLIAQTYSAPVDVKPEVVIWDTSVKCEGVMSYVRRRVTSCFDSAVTVVVLCTPHQIGQLMRPMGNNSYYARSY